MKFDIQLKSSHLIIPAEISNKILDQNSSVYVAYKEELGALLLSPKENDWFPKLHESLAFILKSKDMRGTKSVAIREILIDKEIDDSDKSLACSINEDKKFLKILLPKEG